MNEEELKLNMADLFQSSYSSFLQRFEKSPVWNRALEYF